MFNKISERFYSWAKGWLVLLFLILDVFFGAFVMPIAGALLQDGTGLIQPLDLMMFATPDKLFAMVERYGEAGRDLYIKIELTADIVYPIVYLFFFGLLISWLFQRGFAPGHPIRNYNIAPLGAWFFDLLENIAIVVLVSGYPSQPLVLGWLVFMFSALKWLFAFASVGLLLTGLIAAARNWFKVQV